MSRRLLTTNGWVALIVALLFVLFVLLLVGTPSPAQAAFQGFDSSYYGTGQTDDLTGRVPRPVPLEETLPIDTSAGNGWTETTFACNQTALFAALDAAVVDTVKHRVVFPTNCQITADIDDGTWYSIPDSADYFELVGNADGLSEIIHNSSTNICTQFCDNVNDGGYQIFLFTVGSNSNSEPSPGIAGAEWTWDSGYAYNTDIVGSDQAISEVYEGDIVRLKIDAWGNATSNDYRGVYRVLCARWNDSTVEGTDCTGITADNQIKIDRVHQFDMEGTSYYEPAGVPDAPFTGHTITHVERLGGGTTENDNVPEHIGFRNFTIRAVEDAVFPGFAEAIWIRECYECWVTDMTFGDWGSSKLQVSNDSASVLIEGNGFSGEVWRSRCVMEIAEVYATNPMEVRFASNSIGNKCGDNRFPGGNGSTEPYIHFSAGLAGNADPVISQLADKKFEYDCNANGNTECDTSDQEIRVQLGEEQYTTDVPSGVGLVGTVDALDWAAVENQFGVAAVYIKSGAHNIQFINNYFDNTRIGVIFQEGPSDSVVAYNHFSTGGVDKHCGRYLFIHGGLTANMLWEGNTGDCGHTTEATASQGEPIGPQLTLMRNRHISRGTPTHSQPEGGGDNDSGISNEASDQNGQASEDFNWIVNFLGGYSNARPLGSCDNDDNGGCEVPYRTYNHFVGSNCWHGEVMTSGSDFETLANNPTFDAPDLIVGDNDNIADCTTLFSGRSLPSSLLYDTTQTEPDYWCEESGTIALDTFPGVGSDFDTTTVYTKIPAQIRLESGTCTAVSGSPPATPVTVFSGVTVHGASAR